jgi:hypothetical protein
MSSFSADSGSASAVGGREGEETRPIPTVESEDDGIGDEASDKSDFNDWQADEDEDEDSYVKSLFCSTKLRSITELIEHDKVNFHFDLVATVKEYCSDDFSYIKLINFIRTILYQEQRREQCSISEIIDFLSSELTKREFLEGDTYLKPVDENDPLLFLFDEIFEFNYS